VSHAAILDGTTGAEAVDGNIYGVRNGTIAANTGNYDNTGDDTILSAWFWIDYATLTVEGGYVPFKTMAMLSGASVTSSGASPNDYYSLPLWNKSANNQPPKPVLIKVPAKDVNGVIREIWFVLYKVIFAPFSFTGPQYKSGLLLTYTGRAVLSALDETGAAVLGEPAIGRIINRPPS
jgi:hypothetical protein